MYGCNGSLSWLMNYYAGANTSYGSSLTFSTVSSNLYANKMMVARWGWTSGGGHFVVIYACYTLVTGGGNYNNVSYANPSSGSKVTEDYNYFKSNSSRTWTHSLRMNGAAVRRDGVIAENIEMSNGIRLYPNPADGLISLERIDAESSATLLISNAFGQLVKEIELPAQQSFLTIELSNDLSSGMYYVTFLTDGSEITEKLIVN
jgi:hypothetical protein